MSLDVQHKNIAFIFMEMLLLFANCTVVKETPAVTTVSFHRNAVNIKLDICLCLNEMIQSGFLVATHRGLAMSCGR